ncbi:uncharacterized protein LOC126688203 [Mercurialis annua]|uniref:uncharacterized protein LOC126688203 n=1 Tax=Mercurialis annua TaxID=3986 RepID=UPI00215E8A8B|nr:uncharacterized protein LOC126688203 [Mercurialis annua]XP_050238784.1 uncharacterized protein LOC126688203 [Mercurialis annua]
MEDHSRPKLNSLDQKSSESTNSASTRGRQSLNLDDRFKPEKSTFSFNDLHHQNTKSTRDISPKRRNFLKQHRKAARDEELVKYMSNLPSYLERGEHRQEKVLNVGVLDWGRLEKWQCSQEQICRRSSRHSLSSGNTFSSLSTECSSVNSSSSQSYSSSDQRSRRPSLQFHLMSSPSEVRPQNVKSFQDGIQKYQHVKSSQTKIMNEQEKIVGTDKLFLQNNSEMKLKKCSGKDLDSKNNIESKTFEGSKLEAIQRIKTTTGDGECIKTVNKLLGQKAYTTEKDIAEKINSVHLHPQDHSQGDCSQISKATMLGCKEAEASRRSSAEMQESSTGVLSSGVPHSCPLICKNNVCAEIKRRFSEAESISFLPNSSQSIARPVKRGISPSRGSISEIKKSSVAPITSTSKTLSTDLELKPSKTAAEKPRSTSPFLRRSIGLGKIIKSFNSKEDLNLPQLNTAQNFAKSASSDVQNATSRARSSPLRRLLDPLLKAKEPNCYQYGEQLPRDSVSTDKACKSSRGLVDSTNGARQPGIIKLDIRSCKEVKVDDSFQEKKRDPSAVQAFLQIASKNGQPLFTFAVGNERKILAATMKNLGSSREGDYSCIYTFFSVKEVRKKNGRWINQGGKDKSHEYIPDVIAQLKVSGTQLSESFAREFVLFSVDLSQAAQQTLDLQPNNELAAIVVKIPKATNKGACGDGDRTSKRNDFPESGEHCMISQSLISTTLILPSAIHSLPNKGGPSSLIQRWRSGGSCDCGGWDLGCKLRIFGNDSQHIKISSSSKACSISDKFELISQGGEEEIQRVFSLTPYKDGIYSVQFISSLSVLQAFSLCIAVLDSKKLCKTFATSLETITAQNNGIKATPNGINGELPARYVSNPPHSPVGRV